MTKAKTAPKKAGKAAKKAPAPKKVVRTAKATELYRTPGRDLYVQSVEVKGTRRYVHCLSATGSKFRATVIQETAFFEAKPVLLSVNGVSVKELNKAKAAKTAKKPAAKAKAEKVSAKPSKSKPSTGAAAETPNAAPSETPGAPFYPV